MLSKHGRTESVSRHAVCLKASSRFNHSLIWFQLAPVWSTNSRARRGWTSPSPRATAAKPRRSCHNRTGDSPAKFFGRDDRGAVAGDPSFLALHFWPYKKHTLKWTA